jgi:hypothetical protein
MIVVLSGASAGVASTTFGSSAAAGNAVAEAWAVAGAVTAPPVSAVVAAGTGPIPLAAGAGAAVLGAAVLGAAVLGAAVLGAAVFGDEVFGDEVFADTEGAGEGVGAAAFAAGGIAGWLCGVVREDARAEISGLPLGGATTAEAGGGESFAGAVIAAGAAAATDGTAAARTLVTIARAATGVFSGSLGRSTRESTTPAPAVAPIAVATRTTRAVRAKLGAGAK